MNAQGYGVNAAECRLAAKSCQPCYRSLLFSPTYAGPADEAIDALLVVR
jgi:hypothetical protein